MKLKLTTSNGKTKCRNESCKKLPEYISEKGRIKNGTTCVSISIRSASGYNDSFFCRDCIDEVYSDMKKILNPSLWSFL